MIRDCKTVDLFLYGADQCKHSLLSVYADLRTVSGHQRPCAVTIIFHHTEHGNI